MIEMATAKPPFVELGNPMAAVFRVGRFQQHPEIPDCLSVVAHEVLKRSAPPLSPSLASQCFDSCCILFAGALNLMQRRG